MSHIDRMPPMNDIAISVIICAHNPHTDYLRRTLEALRVQSLPRDQWELLLVDNASKTPLANLWDLSWHPRGRHILELSLGLTPARLRGIKEAKGELIVFVDDDNVLAKDYLQAASDLFARRLDLGVASGRILPEYETPPPAWFAPHESWIAIRRIERSRWANFHHSFAEPCGAGMCLRREVAAAYVHRVADKNEQLLLGRRGESLLSGEDVVIAKLALGLGYSMGQFIELNVLHLIPSRRIGEEYLFSLYRHILASGQLISWLENQAGEIPSFFDARVWLKAALRFIKGTPIDRRLVIEEFRARNLARKIIAEFTPATPVMKSVTLQKA